ncbi:MULTISPECIES: helix-turn-helix domain-containing protein [Providencia]|uniref:Helix-turn-helix domain-containing protein n=3 Tax=Providencia TaxID=586 RepID=A0A264VTP3_PRORE|nr:MULTISPECIES: helix-turn-helix transcriptional regulator [Providencia]MRF68468.1 helix-turn-helix domain-containing protein [Escherichia coli]EFE54191.1 DNA-binding helix-turn-helix protein [Providencia rettgeri DSM 1131]MBG5893139.1 helix-turn-helix transcriptional regulator [Providencia rettgeri]MBI6190521.1 helix-turn-helix transcriptional regulator [Providencia rettgeri]MBJ9970170.1 helix-turn-helix transcriptional regulator [Providencia rettgeri]
MINVNRIVGREIRKRRKHLGLSGIELANLVGVSQQQISRYERGECNINIENLHTLANALDTEMICFFIDDVFINKESN